MYIAVKNKKQNKKMKKIKKTKGFLSISHPYPWFNQFVEDSIEIMEEINTDQMSEPEKANTGYSDSYCWSHKQKTLTI